MNIDTLIAENQLILFMMVHTCTTKGVKYLSNCRKVCTGIKTKSLLIITNICNDN